MTRYAFMGFDPGFTGAMAALLPYEGDFFARVRDMPLLDRPGKQKRLARDALAGRIVRMVGTYSVDRIVAAVEAVGAMGHADRKEGASSMFRFGQGQGEVLGVLSGIGAVLSMTACPVAVIVFEVPASVWKVKVGLSSMSKDEVTARAEADFPECAGELRGPRGGAKHGRAEALYLARYARFLVTGKGLR